MKKLLLSILAIFLVIGLVGAGTFAWFQDTETSTGNTFTAGTMDLKMEGPEGNWVDGVTQTWTMSNMVPGASNVFGKIELGSFGTLTGDHLEIGCTYTVNDDPDVESDTDKQTYLYPERFARYMEIILMVYTNDTWWFDLLTGQKYLGSYPNTSNSDGDPQAKWRVDDQESSGQPGYGVISLYDLNQDPIDDLPPPDGGNTQFKMKLKLHSSADNGIQGDTLNLTMIFTLNQDSSQ